MGRCRICGGDTEGVDWEYLIGDNHLGCSLQWEGEVGNEDRSIRGWGKLEGIRIGDWRLTHPQIEGGRYIVWGIREGETLPDIRIELEGSHNLILYRKGWSEGERFPILERDTNTLKAFIHRVGKELI